MRDERATVSNVMSSEGPSRMRVIRQASLEKCELMSSGTYEFPEPLHRADWVLLVAVAAVFGTMAFLGFLV